jgi:hypothetical protein
LQHPQQPLRPSRHPIKRETPAVNFFEGALLGNGGMGCVVCSRPDAVMIHFGHNNVWDIRINEEHKDEYGTFQSVFEKLRAVPPTAASFDEDPWCANYFSMVVESYAKAYPRPFPCGTLILGFDRRTTELLGHHLDISTGLCRISFLTGGLTEFLEVWTDMDSDRLWMRMVDVAGHAVADPFDRVNLLPHPIEGYADWFEQSTADPSQLPQPVALSSGGKSIGFRQRLPCAERWDLLAEQPGDHAFRMQFSANRELTERTPGGGLDCRLLSGAPLLACVTLEEGLANEVPSDLLPAFANTTEHLDQSREACDGSWKNFWSRSGVILEDEFLERVWYWNHYFLNCAVKAGVQCPGLFANWSHGNIGSAWHGDYHMNYNTQQPFWLTFSSNHLDKNLPYVELVERVLPLSRQWARDYYGLRGAFGMHSLYPVAMTTNPYPSPDWGWEICETPWTMQGLWWHYLYTKDVDFLRARAFVPIREAVLFMVDYMKRPEARGEVWGDDRYHIFPTTPPELYAPKPGFPGNHDCLVDLTLTRFLFRSYQQACAVLEMVEQEAELLAEVQEVLAHFPDYPTAESPSHGRVFITAPEADPEVIYNTPNSLMTVFPGEHHGLHSSPEDFEIAANSYRQHRNEGGNELVFLNLQGARLGLLDLVKFKRQIAYCQLPNGTCADKCLQSLGRYNDRSALDFMSGMGIWFENFSLPVVINECLLQSYSGNLRLFPNWPLSRQAEFYTLRAVGAFLVSAACGEGRVEWIEIFSEKGGLLSLISPWPETRISSDHSENEVHRGPILNRPTEPGETLRMEGVR